MTTMPLHVRVPAFSLFVLAHLAEHGTGRLLEAAVAQGETARTNQAAFRGSLADAGRGGNPVASREATTANAASSATVNPYVERLKLATLLYGISLFMSWGVLYWGIWYEGIIGTRISLRLTF